MKILFSPVGMTDPVSEEFDKSTREIIAYHEGALLQILRNERPEQIYLYLSKEAIELEQQDHRYLEGIRLLEADLEISFDVRVIERPELVDVHLFDVFMNDFRDILTDIREKNPDAEILVNVSSGTPAMKSTLQILAAASELNLKPLQVATWTKNSNHPRSCDIQAEWALNADRQPDAGNRVTGSSHTNLLYEFNRKVLMQLIDEYDYHAAMVMSQKMRNMLPSKFMDLLKAAMLRSDAKFRDAYQQLRVCGKEDLMADYQQVSEYFLLLDIYVKKEKYTDFLRAMTPFMLEILIASLRQKCGIDVHQYTRRNDLTMWDDFALQNSGLSGKFDQLPVYHQNDRRRHRPAPPLPSGYILSWHLTNLIENYADPRNDRQFVTTTLELRSVEECIRNLAAHTMQGFSAADFQRETHRTPRDMIVLMKNYMRNYTDIPLSDDFLNAYPQMNEKLKSYL